MSYFVLDCACADSSCASFRESYPDQDSFCVCAPLAPLISSTSAWSLSFLLACPGLSAAYP